MDYKIVLDSCGEFSEEMKADPHFASVPLVLTLDGTEQLDDESFDQADFLKRMKDSSEGPKSASPSPERYYQEFVSGPKEFYVVTLSSNLSSSYASAQTGAQMALEEVPDLKIHVFDSKSASPAETLIGKYVWEMKKEGASFEEIVEAGEAYIKRQVIYFVLEDLDVFRKNGRLTGIKAVMTSALKLRPIMSGSDEGTIIQADLVRGTKKAIERVIELVVENQKINQADRIYITHCACPERAEKIRDSLLQKIDNVEVKIHEARGVSSMYANAGGFIVAF